jgi:hypothetical protein
MSVVRWLGKRCLGRVRRRSWSLRVDEESFGKGADGVVNSGHCEVFFGGCGILKCTQGLENSHFTLPLWTLKVSGTLSEYVRQVFTW